VHVAYVLPGGWRFRLARQEFRSAALRVGPSKLLSACSSVSIEAPVSRAAAAA